MPESGRTVNHLRTCGGPGCSLARMARSDDRTDAEIIAESRRRPQIFEVIFDRHFEAVLRFASARVGMGNAGDVAAEVFVRAFGLRARFDAAHPSALPWLFGITANVCREQLRKAARGRRARLRHGTGLEASSIGFETEAVARVDARARRPDLEEAMRQLSDDEYAVLMIAAIGGVSYREMADHLGIPVGTVRSRLSRARRRVRELLEGERAIQDGIESQMDVAVEPSP